MVAVTLDGVKYRFCRLCDSWVRVDENTNHGNVPYNLQLKLCEEHKKQQEANPPNYVPND